MGCAAPNPLHWQDLRAQPPEGVLSKPGVECTPGATAYELGFMDGRFRIETQAETVEELWPVAGRPLSQEFQILLIRYLTLAIDGQLTGDQVTEKDLPGGATFFQGPHELPVHALVQRYGNDPQGFAARGLELGATRIEHGDVGLRFFPFPETPVSLILWAADDEFGAQISAVFDGSICHWFELDMVFLLVRQLSRWIIPESTKS
jgi:hypothetical protein